MALQTVTFTQNIKTLLKLDDEIRVLQDQLKELRKQKDRTEEVILATMLERKWLNIDAGKRVLSVAEKKHYSSLSFTYLEKTLSQIIPDKSQIEYVMKYVKDNRELKVSKELVLVSKD